MLSALIPGFLSRHPRVTLEVVVNDTLVDIVAQGSTPVSAWQSGWRAT